MSCPHGNALRACDECDALDAQWNAGYAAGKKREDALLVLLRKCSDELAGELSTRYPPAVLEYPCMQQDYDGDMRTVIAARAVLATYDAHKHE